MHNRDILNKDVVLAENKEKLKGEEI